MTQIRETGGNGGIPAMPPACPKINALNPPPRGLRVDIKKSIFSQPPRLSTSRLPLPHGSPRRSAKNALLYVTPLQPKNARSWRADIWAIAFESLILWRRVKFANADALVENPAKDRPFARLVISLVSRLTVTTPRERNSVAGGFRRSCGTYVSRSGRVRQIPS